LHSKNTCPEEKPSSKHRPLAHGPPFSRYIFLKAPSFFLPLTSSILKGKSVFHEVKAPQCTVHHTRARLTTIRLEIRATAKQNTQTHAEVRESSQGRCGPGQVKPRGPHVIPPAHGRLDRRRPPLPLRGERLYVRPRANPMPRRPLTWGPAADSGGQWLPWHARSRAAAAAAKG